MLRLLNGFSQGIGCGINDVTLVFSDDPDENDPNQMRDYPELENYEGVGFFSDFYPSPLLVSYQEFYDHLKLIVEEFIAEKDINYKNQALMFLEKIRTRYKCKGDSFQRL